MRQRHEPKRFNVHDGAGSKPVCPYFGSEESECELGNDHSTGHDVELMVSFCNGRYTRCSRYRMLTEEHKVVRGGSFRLPRPEPRVDSPEHVVMKGVLQHELRTPLTAILTSAEILERKPERDVETRQRFVGVIKDESLRMKKTVEDLFDGLDREEEPQEAPLEESIEQLDQSTKLQDSTKARSNEMSSKKWNQGWSVVLAGTGINLALGILYTWSIFKNSIKADIESGGLGGFNWDMASINDPYAICCLVFAFAMIVAGKVQDRFGPRATAMTGGLLVGMGFVLVSQSTDYWMWVLGFGVLAGTGIGFGYSAATPPALKWFPPARTGLIAGIVVSGFGLASVYIAPLAKFLLAEWGLQKSMFFFGVAFSAVVGGLSLLLVNPPQNEATKAAAKKNAKAVASTEMGPKQILKTPGFYALWITFFVGSGAGLMVIGSVAGMAKASLGEMAFVAVAVMAIGNAGGRIVAGVLSDRIGRGLTLSIMMLFQAALMFSAVPIIDTTNPSAVLLVTLAGLIGFNYGTNLALFPAFAKDRWGLANFGINYGILFSAWGVGGLVMGKFSQSLIAQTGNYNSSFVTASGALLMGATVAMGLEETRRPILRVVSKTTGIGKWDQKDSKSRKAA